MNLKAVKILALTGLLFYTSAFAVNSTARYLLWQPSARAIAMGGAGNTVSNGVFATFYNPASLAFLKKFHYSSSYGKPIPFLTHTAHALDAVSYSFDKIGTIGFTYNRYWQEAQLLTNESGPEGLGGTGYAYNYWQPSHWQLKLSYAALLSKNLAFGISSSVLRIKLSSIGAGREMGSGETWAFLFDGGLLYRNILTKSTWHPKYDHQYEMFKKWAPPKPDNGMAIGISISNAGMGIAYIDERQKDNPPTIATLGLSYCPISSPLISLLIAADFDKEIFEESTLDYIHMGNEIRFLDVFAVQTGYFLDTFEPNTSYFTWGLGFVSKYASVYLARFKRAYLPSTYLDFNLSLEF